EEHNRRLEETVRQRTERLLQSEKVATMGSLLAGVAHELNNPLTVLSAQAQLLGETQDPALTARATKIRQAAERCVRIVRNFLAFARQRAPERSPTLLGDVVRGTLELLAYELRVDGVEVAVDLAPDLTVLWVDPHQLHQVLVNLVANAHHALRRHPPPRRVAVVARHDAERRRVRLEIADTGPGMPADVRAKIFEPFFTTKPVLDGESFYHELAKRHPALRERIVFLTGDVLGREKREFLEGTGAPFLTKPCDLDELRRVIARLLASPPRA